MTTLRWALLALLITGMAITFWATRPDDDHSPLTMLSLLSDEKRIDNFRHMERIFPSVPLAPSRYPQAFPRQDGHWHFPEHFDTADGARTFDDFMATTSTVGLQLYHRGVLVSSHFREGMEEHQPWTSWSIAKSIIATGIARALQEGKLESLEQRVGELIPALNNSDWGKVTLRNLLTMTTGMDFDESYHSALSDIRQLFYRTFMFRQPIRQRLADMESYRAQGTKFDYISVNTVVLAWVLESVTGQSTRDYLQESLWETLGMQDAGLINVDFEGFPAAFCCMSLSARDYAKLGQLYLQHGQWNGEQLLPESWVQEATRRPEPWLVAGNKYPERGYGYHLWIPKDPDAEYFFNGVWGQTLWVDEKAEVVIVKLGADKDYLAHMAMVIDFMRATSAPFRIPDNAEDHDPETGLDTQ